MSYAVIETGGRQFRVQTGDVVRVPSIDADVGASIEFNPLALYDGETLKVGRPAVDGFLVRGSVIEHGRERKILVFKFRRRKHYRRLKGHRQGYTAIRIHDISEA